MKTVKQVVLWLVLATAAFIVGVVVMSGVVAADNTYSVPLIKLDGSIDTLSVDKAEEVFIVCMEDVVDVSPVEKRYFLVCLASTEGKAKQVVIPYSIQKEI